VKPYTIIYALTRTVNVRDECYHHLAHVTAEDPRAAETLCRVDTIPGFSYQTLIIFNGHLTALDVGDHVMHHAFDAKGLS
jgi:hypothetical protein